MTHYLMAFAILCSAATASADTALCEDTGGSWNECGSGCGPFTCENPSVPNQPCPFICIPQCECPVGQVWDALVGCKDESLCESPPGEPTALCELSGGTWTDCGSGCGPFTCSNPPVPNQPCPDVCIPQCKCAEGEVFDPVNGCVHLRPVEKLKRKICATQPVANGTMRLGVWTGYVKQNKPSMRRAPVCKPQCDCGVGQVWDELLGCVDEVTKRRALI